MQEVELAYGQGTVIGMYRNGQFWLKGVSLTNTLGVSESYVRGLYSKHRKWFGPEETIVVQVPTPGGSQEVRLFSEVGAAMMAMFSHRPQAIPFKKWLMRRAFARETPALPDGKPARAGHVLSLEEAKLLDFLAPYAEPGSKIEAVISRVRNGTLRPGADPAVAALASKYQGANNLMAEAKRVYSEIDREAREMGYHPDAVRREAKRMRLGEDFPQLAFGEADRG